MKISKKTNFEKIVNVLNKYEYVSFDIFDTLLVRNIESPNDIFKLVELEAKEQKLIDDSFDFYVSRTKAAEVANLELNEPTIDEIYSYLKLNNNQKDSLKKLEIEIENRYLQRNQFIYDIYVWCKENNEKVIAISDMYLPHGILQQILNNKNICVDKIYVSCDYKTNKRNGELFRTVKDELKTNSIIHIGDSLKGDYIEPKKQGINSIQVVRNKYNNKNKALAGSVVESVVINNKSNNVYYDLGYSVLGPLLYGFTNWLHRNVNEQKAEIILFFSRDGKIIKDAYLRQFNDIECEYIHVSRRTLNVACLWMNPEFENLKDNIVVTNLFSIKSFIKRIGLNPENYTKELLDYNLDVDYEYYENEFWKDDKIRLFYEDIKIDVINNSKIQYDYLIKYLSPYIKKNIAIVDIGWRGSMQKRLMQIFSVSDQLKDIVMHGYYLGIETNQANMSGYLYQTQNQTDNKTAIDAGVGLFESLFLAREGTTLSYEEKEKKIVPILDSYEIKDKELINNLTLIHSAALEFIDKIISLKMPRGMNITEKEVFKYFKRVVYMPTKQEIEKLGIIPFNDTKNTLLINKRKNKIASLANIKKDYKNAPWKIGYLVSNISFRFPWNKIYQKLKG